MKLSVVLATYNEEKNLRDCLKSVKGIADEIIIVDGESSDSTVDIAKKFDAKILIVPNQPIFHINKQIALEQAKGEWILQLDADERVDEELKQAIKGVSSRTQGDSLVNGYYLKRKNFFLGTWLKKGGQYPDPVIRLVKKGHAHFPSQSVHEQIVVNGTVDTLPGHLLHYTAPTFDRYLRNSNRYTSLTAAELKKQHLSFTLFNWLKYLIWKPKVTFFSLYIRHKGFMDGFPGFIFALFSSLHWATSYIKYWELCHVKKMH